MKQSKKIVWLDVKNEDIFLFGSAFVFMMMLSVIASIPNMIPVVFSLGSTVLNIIAVISFITVIVINCCRWINIIETYNDLKKYCIVNGAAILLYMVASVAFFELFGKLTYLLVFNSHRVFELLFNLDTAISIALTNLSIIISFVLYLVIYINRQRRYIRSISVDDKQLNPNIKYTVGALWKSDIYNGRTKDNKPVTDFPEDLEKPDFSEFSHVKDEALWRQYLSDPIDIDILDEYKHEFLQYLKLVNPYLLYDTSHLWGNIKLGKNGIEPKTDEYGVEADNDVNPSGKYSSESLWNSDIYNGRTKDNKPVTDFSSDNKRPDYSEFKDKQGYLWRDNLRDSIVINNELWESYKRDVLDVIKFRNNYSGYEAGKLWDHVDEILDKTDIEDVRKNVNPNKDYDIGSLWSKDMYIGKGNDVEFDSLLHNEEINKDVNPNKDYDVNSLWSKDMHMGKKRSIES